MLRAAGELITDVGAKKPTEARGVRVAIVLLSVLLVIGVVSLVVRSEI
jgi:hypothetical protein